VNIQEIRSKYPEYNDMSDTQLASALHKKYYADIPFDDFSGRVGLNQKEFTGQIPQDTSVADFDINAATGDKPAGFVPPPAQGSANLNEALFGKPGSKLMPGAEPLKWMAENPEVVGATAASLLAPEFALPAQLASKAGPMVSQFLSQAATKVPAAFMGGFGGNLAGQMTGSVKTEPNAEMSDIILSNLGAGGRMAAAETTGAMLNPVLTKMFAPGAASLTPESSSLMKFAQERNIPTSPSSLAPSAAGRVSQDGLDTFLPSRLATDSSRKKSIIRFNQLMTEIPEEVGKIEGNSVLNPKALQEIGSFLQASRTAGKELSTNFIDDIGAQTVVPVSNLKSVLTRVNKTATDEALRNWVATKSGQIKGKVTAEELEEALRQIGGIKPKADKKWLEEIRKAIKSDFEAAGAKMETLDASNKAFSENYGLMGKKFASDLSEEAARGGDGSRLTVKIFRSGNESFVNALEKEASKEGGKINRDTYDSLLAQNLQNMIQNASTESQKLMGLRIIDGAKLEKMLESNKSVLEVAYKNNPKTLDAMRNLARLAKASRQDLSIFEKGMSDTVKAGNVAALAGGFLTNPAGLLLGSGGSVVVAKSLMNPNGKMFKWLTTGFDAPVRTQEAVNFGGRLGFSSGE
jgi:hypothetical protein